LKVLKRSLASEEDGKMKSAYVFCLLAFAFFSLPAAAQSSSYHSATPVERFPGDPVQGGAMKEYQAPPERPQPHGRVGGPHGYGYGSSYPRPEGRSFPRGAEIDTSMLPPPAPRQELVEQSRNGVHWLCGGIGAQEVAYMKREAPRYDMMLTFAARNGAYLADINVAIVEDNGHVVLQTKCDGPIMLVDLPGGGTYRVRAQHESHEVMRTVWIQGTQARYRHVVMRWPESAEDMSSGPLSSGQSEEAAEGRGAR
jgi:hypothetical protein